MQEIQPTPVAGGSRVVAHSSYRLRTLTVRSDALVVVLRGTKHLISPTTRLCVHAGQSVMIAADTRWDVINDPHGHPRYEALLVPIDNERTQAAADHAWPRSPQAVHHARVLTTDSALLQAVERTLDGSLSPPVLRHRIQEVSLLLAERGWVFASRRERSWIDRVRDLVAQRPDADWSVSTLAAVFHTSESTLRRRLQDADIPLAALVRETRLETALSMLQTTSLGVGEIAQRCGWASHSRFSAAFQSRWGVAPREVRSQPVEQFKLERSAQVLTRIG